jgi:DNA-binding MarR family transcriptional regulator
MSSLPFGFDRPEDSQGFLLWQTSMIWQRKIKKALEQYHVFHAQFVIMAIIMWFEAHGYDTTQTLIVNQTKLDKMTVSKSIRKLVELGCVNRVEHGADMRAKSVSLTEKGKSMVCTLVPIIEEIDGTFFGKASHKEQKDLAHILAKLITGSADE